MKARYHIQVYPTQDVYVQNGKHLLFGCNNVSFVSDDNGVLVLEYNDKHRYFKNGICIKSIWSKSALAKNNMICESMKTRYR